MILTPWRRYGHHRIYVRTDDGTDVGWWDVAAGVGHPADGFTTDQLADAVGQPAATLVPPSESVRPASIPEDAGRHDAPAEAAVQGVERALPPDPGPALMRDLAANRPGEQLRSQIDLAHANGQRPTLLRRMFLGKAAYSSWELGSIGEERVAGKLAQLTAKDPRWSVVHSIPVGTRGSDIDHIVVGPGGVFTINSKHHDGANVWVRGDTVLINGQYHPYVRNARHEAARAAQLLTAACGFPVDVQGLVVVVRAENWTVREQPADVRVVPRMQVSRYLRKRPEVLPHDQRLTIADAVRRESTWKP